VSEFLFVRSTKMDPHEEGEVTFMERQTYLLAEIGGSICEGGGWL